MRRGRSLFLFLVVLCSGLAFAQGPTPHGADLTWTWSQGTGSAGTGFRVYRATVAGGPYTRIFDGSDITQRAFSDNESATNPLVEGQNYCYAIGTKGVGGSESTLSNEICGVIPKRAQTAQGLAGTFR